jgi:hypothetical protein
MNALKLQALLLIAALASLLRRAFHQPDFVALQPGLFLLQARLVAVLLDGEAVLVLMLLVNPTEPLLSFRL